MFTLGFPPVPFSITNVNVDRRFAKDITNPFSLLEFIKTVANLVESNNVTTYYSHYITTWNNFKNKKTSTSNTLIVEGYRSFVKDLTLNYNSEAENKFLSNIDYSDPYDLDVATKFIAAKIKSIADYYRTKREEVKLEPIRKKYKASTKGFVSSIKEKIVEFLTNNANQTVVSNIDTITSNLNVNVDPLYDAETGYFNKQPDQNVYGQYDRDYNDDIFLKSNTELVAKVFAGLSTTNQILQEVDNVFDNKRELTKKYMGTDFFYISATPVISNIPVLNVQSNTSVRYNTEFIKVLTTTLPASASTTTSPTTAISATTTQSPGTTTVAPSSNIIATFERKYSCVNFNCLSRKDGEFKTKEECQASCKKPTPTDPTDTPPPPPPVPKPTNSCSCKDITFTSSGPHLRETDQANDVKDCITPDVIFNYEVIDSIAWSCSNTDYEARNLRLTTLPNKSTLENNTFTNIFNLGCTEDVLTASEYGLDIVYKPTGAFISCYFAPGSTSVTYTGPKYEDFLLKKLTCCPTDGAPTSTTVAPSGSTVTPTPSGSTITPAPSSNADCPECDGPPTEPSPTPTEPTVAPTPTDSTTDCPPCSDGGSSGSDSTKRGKAKNYTVKGSTSNTTSTNITNNTTVVPTTTAGPTTTVVPTTPTTTVAPTTTAGPTTTETPSLS